MLKPEAFFSDLINKTLTYRFHSFGIENISNFDKENIDKVIVQIGNIQTNALGLSILLGDVRLMRYLIEKFQADFSVLEEQLQYQNLSMTEFLILNFNQEVFMYALPLYLKREAEQETFQLDDTIQFVSLCLPKLKKKVHPMRYAAEIGNITFFNFVLNTFKNKTPPESFDIHAVDEETGENCALIACAQGNLELIITLHKQGCDFRKKNNKNETAINLVIANFDHDEYKALFSILTYLIEHVKLDVTENFEETLMLCSSKEVSEYIEEKLKNCGINTSKRVVDSKYESSFILEKFNQESNDITSMPSLISSIEQCELSYEAIL